ncbi:MAG: prolyl oligopeptidase family serine peptidase [Candidatus Izemoplasmatales bacterium]
MDTNVLIPHFLDHRKRDAVLIMPGGGYWFTSARESLPIARRFQVLGFHAAVFEYRHVRLYHPDVIDEAIAVAESLSADPRIDRLFVIGFSAGGHLALHLAERRPKLFSGVILAYPVVTSDPRWEHHGSIDNLLGDDRSPARLRAVSLERHVPKAMPPLFVWHTMDDGGVPVENSLRLIAACRRKGVSVEAHLFPHGVHGLALADDTTPWDEGDQRAYARENTHVATWFPLLEAWLKTL